MPVQLDLFAKQGSSMVKNAVLGAPRAVPVRGVSVRGERVMSHSGGDFDFRPRGPRGSEDILAMGDDGAIASVIKPPAPPMGPMYGPQPWKARDIVAGEVGAVPFGMGYTGGAVVGGMLGAMVAPEDQRLRGAIMGAGGGMMTGKMFKAFGARGAGFSNSVFGGLESKLSNEAWGPLHRGWERHKRVVHKGLRGFHSAEGRHAMFASGAMLGGVGFGAMFTSNGRSHKRGFNSRRGNSFSR